jgi:hypothetical protein
LKLAIDLKNVANNYHNRAYEHPEKIIENLQDYNHKIAAKIEQIKLSVYAKEYTPRTKALVGAILKDIGLWEEAYKLKSQLNPLTKYKLGIKKGIVKNQVEWGIV